VADRKGKKGKENGKTKKTNEALGKASSICSFCLFGDSAPERGQDEDVTLWSSCAVALLLEHVGGDGQDRQ
jgi:hypothetical protein